MAPAASTAKARSRKVKRGRKCDEDESGGSGILSGVFSFVSQEISNFVASATGRDEDLLSSSSQSASEPESEAPTPPSSRKRTHSPRSPAQRPKRPRSSSQELKVKERPRSRLPERVPSPSPRPILRPSSGSTSMPGSLFPFSPAIIFSEDDDRDDLGRQSAKRHVHFITKSTPGDNEHQDDDTMRGGPSTPRKRHAHQPSSPSRTPRTPSSPAIQVAVSKFREGDPSMLLPSPVQTHLLSSPTRREATQMSEKARGKQASRASPQLESISFDHEQIASHRALPVSKQQQVSAHLADEALGVAAEESFTTAHLKEQISQTAAAIERTTGLDSGTSADKDRIRELEEEVQRLREELARRPSASNPPPPPPPPPPPNGLRIPLPSSLDPSTDASTLFLSARAALKHAGTPKEKPIVSRPGLGPVAGIGPLGPSGGLGPDKMAAFLSEMKNVRLRKVGDKSLADSERSFVVEPRAAMQGRKDTILSKSWSGKSGGIDAGSKTGLARNIPSKSTSSQIQRDAEVGLKRKRPITDADEGDRDGVPRRSHPGNVVQPDSIGRELKKRALAISTSSQRDAEGAIGGGGQEINDVNLSFLSAPSLSVSTSRKHREEREQRRQREQEQERVREQELEGQREGNGRLPSRALSTSIDSTVSASSSLMTSQFAPASSHFPTSITPMAPPPRRVIRDSNGIIRDWQTSTLNRSISPTQDQELEFPADEGHLQRDLHLDDLQAPTPSLCSDHDGDSHEDLNQPRTPPQVSPTSDHASIAQSLSRDGDRHIGESEEVVDQTNLQLDIPEGPTGYSETLQRGLLNEESYTYEVKLRMDSDDEGDENEHPEDIIAEPMDDDGEENAYHDLEADLEHEARSEKSRLPLSLFQHRQPTSPLPEPSSRRCRPPATRASPRVSLNLLTRSSSMPTSRRLRSPPPPPITQEEDELDEQEPLARSLSLRLNDPKLDLNPTLTAKPTAVSAPQPLKAKPASRIPFPSSNPTSASNLTKKVLPSSVPVDPRERTASSSSISTGKTGSKIPVPIRTRKVSGTPHPVKSRRNSHVNGERLSMPISASQSTSSTLHETGAGGAADGFVKTATKPANKRRLTLDEELRNALPLPLSREDLEDIEDADVYSGLGSMEPRGFFAHGGAGGPGVWIDPGT